jgi:hypothetical protein
LNPHDRIDHKILSLARLPVPTLPHIIILPWSSALPPCHNDYNTRCGIKCQQFF